MNEEQMIFGLHLGVGVLFVVMGVPLWREKIPPNGWYGVRTPATLRDSRIWYPANRLGGVWFIVVGGVTIATCVVTFLIGLKMEAAAWTNLAVILSFLLATIVHCLVVIGRLKREFADAPPGDSH